MNTNNIQECKETLYKYCKEKLFYPQTNLFYDHATREVSHFPTPEEIRKGLPNPCGHGTGMEDSMISGGTMLDALCQISNPTTDQLEFLHQILEGMICCAETAEEEGFIPRSICLADKKSYYIDSSKDQYTLFIYGCYKCYSLGYCTQLEIKRIQGIMRRVVNRIEKYVTPENNYDLSRADGGVSFANILWGDKLGNHEAARLAMIYLFTYHICRDSKYLEKYLDIREETISKLLPMTNYWALYSMQQMAMSVRMLYDIDTEKRDEYKKVLAEIALHITSCEIKVKETASKISLEDIHNLRKSFRDEKQTPRHSAVDIKLPNFEVNHQDHNSYFRLQDVIYAAYVPYICGRVPTLTSLDTLNELCNRIDISKISSNIPIPLYAALSYISSH